MTSLLFRIAAADRCSLALSNEYRRLTQVHHKALVARAVASAAARLRRRRATAHPRTPGTPGTPVTPATPGTPGSPAALLHLQLRRRRSYGSCHSLQLQKLLQRHLDMASNQEMRRRPSSAAGRSPVESGTIASASATTTTFASTAHATSRAQLDKAADAAARSRGNSKDSSESMPPPPLPLEDGSSTRPSRSTSTASRQANRLSLTLPIALPTRDPSRPTPTSATTSSIPPTPVERTATISPADPNEFIIAIAAQERRVLELREELTRAETELSCLKKRWTSKDAQHKRAGSLHTDLRRPTTAGQDDDGNGNQRSVDQDRRRLMLNTQGTPTHSPTQNRRRVMRGGHTRTLSLLSPTKTEQPDFSVHEDGNQEDPQLPPLDQRTAQLTNATLAKRASWQPRSHHHSKSSSVGVPQIVEDFKLGLRAFVEDIRQITVGDEPITGQSPGPAQGSYRDSTDGNQTPGEQSRSRPTHGARTRVSTALDSPSSAAASPTPSSRTLDAARERAKAGKGKHFSWTPLGFDSLDDNDWSNWESPMSAKSARWSGSTANSAGVEDIPSIPEVGEETITPGKPNLIDIDTPIRAPKLEELLPSMVNRLTPSNIKRTANNLMNEWEKSLVTPESRDKENGA